MVIATCMSTHVLLNKPCYFVARYLGFKKTIRLNRRALVDLIDRYNERSLSWEKFSATIKEIHVDRMGSPVTRVVISDQPKEEDYFYSNPFECL